MEVAAPSVLAAADAAVPAAPGASAPSGLFSAALGGLVEGRAYYARVSAANDRGFGPIPEDGACGPKTALAAREAVTVMGAQALVDAYGAARRDWYYRIGDRRPASRKYARRLDGGKGGWITRAEEFMSPAARLTEKQHRARTAHWL